VSLGESSETFLGDLVEVVRMASQRQIHANRRNARKATGPRTSEGKKNSARNSTKHGLFAKSVLPDEDENAYGEFIEDRVRELDPVGVLECDHAHLIARELWLLLNRFPRLEAALFASDRAERDYRYFWDCVMQYRTSGLEGELRKLAALAGESPEVEILDKARHAEAMKNLAAAEEATRSEQALLGSAFAWGAANGDPVGKLVRYQTASLNRLRHLRAEFDELQARRKSAERR
jgi:hypothetical protein